MTIVIFQSSNIFIFKFQYYQQINLQFIKIKMSFALSLLYMYGMVDQIISLSTLNIFHLISIHIPYYLHCFLRKTFLKTTHPLI